MLYTAAVTKKKKLFQRAYTIADDKIYITDTKRAKKKFLKSTIRNVIFNTDVTGDEVFGSLVKPVGCYDESFLLDFVEEMLLQLTHFLKIELPVDTLAISDKKVLNMAVRYAKTVIIAAADGEDEVIDGVNVIYTKRLKRMPDMAIRLNSGKLPPLLGVPMVDISESAQSSHCCVSWKTMSFNCSLLPYEISAQALMYLCNSEEAVEYHLTSCRKKLPPLFTFL